MGANPDAILSSLQTDDEAMVLEAVRQCTRLLRGDERDAFDVVRVGDRFVALVISNQTGSKVRQAIAEAAQFLPEEVLGRVLPPLLKDPSHYVRDEANRTLGKRSVQRRMSALDEAHDEHLERWRAELGDRFGAGALKLADRIAARSTEHFMGKLHHEATRSLTTLTNSAATLHSEVRRQPPEYERMRRHADIVHERIDVLTALLQSARTLTKSAGPRFARENVHALLEQAVARLRQRLDLEANQKLVTALEGDRKLAIDADREQLLQAVENTVQNAFEAYDDAAPESPRRVQLAFETVHGGMDVEIRISDDGCGMSPEALGQAFVPFGSSKQRGSGFGVPIAKKMVEIVHGGALSLKSAKGRGTTVTITLPLRQGETNARKGEPTR